jgi:hypothetical protein
MPQYLTWEVIEAIERGAYRVLLYGPPGTGKTRSAYETANSLGKSLYNVTLSDETPAAELRGHYVPQGSKWVWNDGPAVRAFREGALLCLDEIDKASQDCLDFLHGLLNDPEISRLTLPTGEIVTPSPDFQVIATMNGDIQDLQPSLQDRFSIAIEIDTPHPNAIKALPKDLRGVAKNVEQYEAQQRPATLRRWSAFATLREIPEVGVENAAKAVFAHRHKELMDAIGFRSTLTMEAPPEEEESEEPCTCQKCVVARARAWHQREFGASTIEFDSDDEVYYCQGCSSSWEDELDALTCCFDDSGWIEWCKSSGRPFV